MFVSHVMGWYRRSARSALLAAALMLAIAGCGDEMTGAGQEPTQTATPTLAPTATETPTPLPTATETPALPPTATAARTSPGTATTPETRPESDPVGPDTEIAPPLAVLTTDSGTQEAGLGTYCWQEGEQGLCLDFAGLPVPEPPLIVEQGKRLTIAVPGIDQLVNVQVEVYDYTDTELDGDTRMLHYPLPEPIRVPYGDTGDTITVTADLLPGHYVIWMFVGFPHEPPVTPIPNATATTMVRGDAVYGFNIEISDTSR